ncbi:MAG TPA: M14 family zinc carboxypeptidase [Gemmatimonadaceae bacterium]
MPQSMRPLRHLAVALPLAAGALLQTPSARAQAPAPRQAIDSAYTAKIHEYLQDPRITTELVDHLPASRTVPTPLKFFGRIVGTPGELTYAKDIDRYFEALDQASPRVVMFNIGKSEEGRDMVMLAVADEATIRDLEKYRGMLNALTDPRKTSEAEAQRLIHTAKPIYWITSGMHSPETGGPEMLMELAYRLAVEETPFIQSIRNNVITLITPVIEVDGREKEVDTYYFNKKLPAGAQRLPLMYWGKYVAHDNNRDGMGQFLKLTQNVTRTFLHWTPTVMHDLHEAQSYLYASTGTGPYNEQLDPIVIDEWWMMAKNDVMQMTRRGVPGVWTWGYYDGWVPNYMFFIANTHNSIGRFYEVQSYGPDNRDLRLRPQQTSREWYRPNPPLPEIKWGPRNNVNIQESAILFALHYVAQNKELYLGNYWLKNKRSVEKGRTGPTFAWVIPATQRRKADAADAVNELRHQGLEIQRATSAFTAGNVSVQPGDYIIRADQPYRTLADMYFAVQNYALGNPRPYDDTGWTFQLMRDITVTPVTDTSILTQRMAMITADVTAPGGITGTGKVLVVDHTADNNLMAFRFKHAGVKMLAAEEDFTMDGHAFRAGAFIIPNADRAAIEPSLEALGLSAWATDAVPQVKTHDLDIPRIGYVHSWQRTQDEGWVRAALDTYGVPYTYFADQKLREGNLRAKYDVIIMPSIGGSATSQVNGIPKTSSTPLPYKRTAATPHLGALDQSDDIRGGMGLEGLMELAKFVEQGGTLIVEGSTSTIFPEYGITNGVTVEDPDGLFVRGSILRGIIADTESPIVYGYAGRQLPVYFNQAPVLSVGGGGFARGFGGGESIPGVGQDITPMATPLRLSPWEQDSTAAGGRRRRGAQGGVGADERASFRQLARAGGVSADDQRPRVILAFPGNPNDMLLSGVLAGGQYLSNRAQVVDAPLGKGHVVMFAIRPFWRWQTQGTFFLGFNAILNWNDLDAGAGEPATRTAQQ